MGLVGDESNKQWSGTIKCGCKSIAVLLCGPVRLFECKRDMLRAALGSKRPFTEDEQGRLICTKCKQEITARKSERQR
jgi:hypothetical protein